MVNEHLKVRTTQLLQDSASLKIGEKPNKRSMTMKATRIRKYTTHDLSQKAEKCTQRKRENRSKHCTQKNGIINIEG